MKKTEIIYGIHAVESVFTEYPERILKLIVARNPQDKRVQSLLSIAQKQRIAIELKTIKDLNHLLGNVIHQGVAAECRHKKMLTENDLLAILDNLQEPPFLLILDEIQDPHNLGACLRTADAAGVHAVIVPKNRSATLTPTAQKVASGAAEAVPFIQVTNLAQTLKTLKDRQIWIYGLADKAPQSLYRANLTGAIAFVLGAEGTGMRRLTSEHCDAHYALPMAGSVSSLNVSVAAGICLYEAVRQRSS